MTGSTAGRWVYEGGASYVAAKHAVVRVRETLRLEAVEQGVRGERDRSRHGADRGVLDRRFGGDAAKAAAVYEGVEPLTAEDVADAIAWVASRPAHVNIDLVQLTPQQQAGVGKVAAPLSRPGAEAEAVRRRPGARARPRDARDDGAQPAAAGRPVAGRGPRRPAARRAGTAARGRPRLRRVAGDRGGAVGPAARGPGRRRGGRPRDRPGPRRRGAGRRRPGLSFRRGGFELAGLRPLVVRALNVLRQYEEQPALEAWAVLRDGLAPGGLLVEGTCDEIGRRAAWVALDADGPRTLTLAAHLPTLERPSELAERCRRRSSTPTCRASRCTTCSPRSTTPGTARRRTRPSDRGSAGRRRARRWPGRRPAPCGTGRAS
jgi:hypothetical protein